VKSFKVLSADSLHSVNFIDELVRIARAYLRRLFGTLGEREFTLDRIYYDDNAELWDIKLTRRINGRRFRYDMSIDNDTGWLHSFGRTRD